MANSENEMIQQVHDVNNYVEARGMQINMKKSAILLAGKGKDKVWTINTPDKTSTRTIHQVNEYKYLGVRLDALRGNKYQKSWSLRNAISITNTFHIKI